MAFANPSFTDIATTTIENRSPIVADNMTKNNALLYMIEKSGGVDMVEELSGGSQVLQALAYAQNPNAAFYSGLDVLATGAADVLSSAAFPLKQMACAVVTSGLEKLQNSGRQALIDLVKSRVKVAESTLHNIFSQAMYSDGTGFGGKQLAGTAAAIPINNTSGVYGGIDCAAFPFWQSFFLKTGAVPSSATIQGFMNTAWLSLVRGTDKPNLIAADTGAYAAYLGSLQNIQRLTDPKMAELGFENVKFMNAVVVLDGGVGGFCDTNTMFFVDSKYMHYRPHKDRNFVALEARTPVNQDAEILFEAWAGALTVSGRQYHGRLQFSA